MAIFKCKMCGGSLEASGESSVVTCEYCGSVQTLPKKNDEIITNLFNRANNLRIKCEFDKAAEVYEKILNEDNADSEAHWGLVLCKYGIEYVEDPKTYKRIPTCHRTQYEAVLSDVDYIAAIKNADPVSAGIYKAQAEQIANLQKDILAIVSNEKPFDVFICYKQTDENGKRTVDSALANDIYYQLTQEGFKVFYSAITLEDKLGYEYEPYIFAALNSAKVMLVVGTKPEYFDAIWVRNEWSRYLKLMKADRSKLLIPCYRDMDAYDLPEEFSHLQAQDMAKIGFVNDVVRGIKKVLKAEAPAAETVVKETVISSGNANTAALLKRAFMFLEDGDFNSANEYCEKVLDNDPECAEAYLAKLMAEGSFRKREDLRNAANPFNGNANYVKAVRFGDDALKAELDGYIEFINQRKIQEELSRRYCFAHSKMREAKTVAQYREAKRLFVLLGDYRDSAAQAQECENLALQKEEVKYEETLGLEKTALEYLNGATIRTVLENYKKLDGYRDCRERAAAFKHKVVARCDELINEGRYEKVSSLSGVISGFEGGADRVRIAKEKLEEQTKKERAKAKRVLILSISGVAALIVGLLIYCFAIKPVFDYKNAEEYLENGDKLAAALAFNELGDYKDAEERSLDIWGEITVRETLSAGYDYTVALKSDGTVVAVGSDDYGQCDVEDWADIVAVSAGVYQTVGLKSDGTVVAVGYNGHGQCNVEKWTDIVAVSARGYHTVGLKSDGTVVAVGNAGDGQLDVSDWRDIVAVSAGGYHTVGLKSDGIVVAVGSNRSGQCDVSSWSDIVAVSAGGDHTVGLKSNGTVVAVGNNAYGQCDVEGWTDIVAVSAGNFYTVGLKSDGTVVSTGYNEYGKCNVEDWADIVAVSAGSRHTVGLKSDGTVVSTEYLDYNKYTYDDYAGQCDVSDWKNIKLP